MVIKVNLVDDHKVVTDGLRLILSHHEDIEILDIASSGEQLLAQLVERQPDIITLDYNLTDQYNSTALNGLETAKKVMALYPDVKILILSMHVSEDVIVPCVESGIHGYMLKSENDFDIYKAVKRLYEQGQYFSPEIATQLVASIRHFHEEIIHITEREQVVLENLFTGKSVREIGDKLYISSRTVETHRKHLFFKFKVKNTIQLIYKAVQLGILKKANSGINI
jgi:DNA-binding NarL/FixJ family response regulator